MISSFLKLALRNLRKQFNFSIINIGGLAIGIASGFVILLFSLQELSYEKNFKDHERIYRISTHFMTMGDFANGPDIVMEVLPDQYPWVEDKTKINGIDFVEIGTDESKVIEQGLYVQENFFSIFNYNFISGSPIDPLGTENSIVITRELADIFFSGSEALNKTIEIGKEKTPFFITGVVDIGEAKSHLNAKFWARKAETEPGTNWLSASAYIYVKVSDGTKPGDIQSALDKLIEDNVFPNMGSELDFDQWIERDDAFRLIAQPIGEIYLKGVKRFDLTAGGNETTVFVLLGIALFILLIASINFINLTTARADKRAKEVGVKKVFGTSRISLIFQFLSESILTSLIAVIVALGLSELILMLFQFVLGRVLMTSVFDNVFNLFIAGGLAIVIGVFSGIYPAFFLSSFKPIRVLKNNIQLKSKFNFRNILVVFQFTLSVTLIISILIMYSQLDFMKKRDLGFDQENVLIIDNSHLLGQNLNAFKEEMTGRSGIASATIASRFPGSTSSFSITALTTRTLTEPQKINRYRGDEDFLTLMGFTLKEGRNFDPGIVTDSSSIILNEAAVKALELENPIGETLNGGRWKVIGVVRDFNFESLRNEIAPLAITLNSNDSYLRLAIKYEIGQTQNVIEEVNKAWLKYVVDEPLQYHFLDDNFTRLMEKDREMSKVTALFTTLAILISCLGLFGLASYVSLQRKKEIGIRKVLGASVPSILVLLNSEFSKLVLISTLLAAPLAGLVMKEWLANFAYRISISPWYFIIAAIATLVIAWATVSYQSIVAAISNPVNSIREE